MFAWLFLLAMETGETYSQAFDTRAECEEMLWVAARSDAVTEAYCIRVPWRSA